MHRSNLKLTPKLWAALNLIEQILGRREQVAVFAPFLDPLDALGEFLSAAGISFQTMDGRKLPKQRAAISESFKQRGHAVQLCGTDSCAEGYSWPRANNIILLAYSWALDRMLQCVDRCHRLDSERDLNCHLVVCEGTVDIVMQSNIDDKGNSSSLILDGQLLEEQIAPMSMMEILHSAHAEFDSAYSRVADSGTAYSRVGASTRLYAASANPATRLYAAGSQTIDESALELEWPALRERLRAAARRWQSGEAGEKGREGEREKGSRGEREHGGKSPLLPLTLSPLLTSPFTPAQIQHPWAARLQRRQLTLVPPLKHHAPITCGKREH